MALDGKLLSVVQAIGADIKALLSRALPAGGSTGQVLTKTSGTNYAASWQTPSGGGGADPWTRSVLSAQIASNSTAFADVSGWTFTTMADQAFIAEADVLLMTAATTNMPRLQVVTNANVAHCAVEIEWQSSTSARAFANGFALGGNALTVTMPAGSAPVASQGFAAKIRIHGISMSGAATVKVQFAAELGTSTCYLKDGSEFRYRLLAS